MGSTSQGHHSLDDVDVLPKASREGISSLPFSFSNGDTETQGCGSHCPDASTAEGSLDMNQNCLLLAQDPLSSAVGRIFSEDIGNTLENEWWGWCHTAKTKTD